MSDGICLTPEQRLELASRYCTVPDEPMDPLAPEAPRKRGPYASRAVRELKRDALIAWILAWPEVADKELLEASEIDADRAYTSQLRAELGIPSAKKQRDDSRRAKILELEAQGVSRREIGRRLGIDQCTVGGIIARSARLARLMAFGAS